MSETVDAVKRLLVDRIHAIDDEKKQLKRALKAVRRGGRNPSRKGPLNRSPVRRGQRQEELLSALKDEPGARPATLAARIGISGSQVSGLLAKARQAGLVKKKGRGYALK